MSVPDGLTPEQVQILSVIGIGSDNAVSTQYLMQITGLSMRRLRKEIRGMRMAGYVICSDTVPGGYYFPDGADETSAFVESMSGRARATFAAVSGARKSLRGAIDGGQ